MARPRLPRALKLARGTLEPGRDTFDEVPPLPASEALPAPPEWLPNGHAVREYQRLGTAMLAHKLLHEGNVGALALLAAVHGKVAQSLAAGTPLQAALVAQYRGLAADLKLTAFVQVPRAPSETRVNRFASNGARPATLPPLVKKP